MEITPEGRRQIKKEVALHGAGIIILTVITIGVINYFATQSLFSFLLSVAIVIPLMSFGLYKGYKQRLKMMHLSQEEKLKVAVKNYSWLGKLAIAGIVLTTLRMILAGIRGQDILSLVGDILIIMVCIFLIIKVRQTKKM